VISRNSHCPVILGQGCHVRLLNEPSEAIGVHRRMKPVITELALEPHTTLVVFTDGVLDAGVRYGQTFDVARFVENKVCDESFSAQALADAILAHAVELDRGRPGDDTSVLVARVVPRVGNDEARRLAVRFPIE
jgi:serine phosphatase RsbU (regulator of sigma subunit)